MINNNNNKNQVLLPEKLNVRPLKVEHSTWPKEAFSLHFSLFLISKFLIVFRRGKEQGREKQNYFCIL